MKRPTGLTRVIDTLLWQPIETTHIGHERVKVLERHRFSGDYRTVEAHKV